MSAPYAFPRDDVRDADGCGIMEGSPGMTLRDYFAGQALAGICAHQDTWGLSIKEIATVWYGLADVMLSERSNATGQEGGAL